MVVAVRQRRRLTEAETRDLRVRHGNLNALTEHHSWAILLEEIEKRVGRIERAVVRQVLHSQEGLSVENQAYLKGYVEGVRAFAATPDQAEARLERFLRLHGVTTTEEENVA